MNKGLSNRFLENFLFPLCPSFVGVYSVDNVPSKLPQKKDYSVIVNLSKSSRPGSHFIALYNDKNDILWYFDSFALPPPFHNSHLIKIISKWVEKNKLKMVLTEPIQDFGSNFCGWHTAAFCMFVDKYTPPNKFHNFFKTYDLRKNEKNVIYLIKKLLK